MTHKQLQQSVARLIEACKEHTSTFPCQTFYDDLMQLVDTHMAEVSKDMKIQGAEELFQLIDKKFESFTIDEALGQVLEQYRKQVRL